MSQFENIIARSYFLQFYAPYTRFFNYLMMQRQKPGLTKYRDTLIALLPTLAQHINKLTIGDSPSGKKTLVNDGVVLSHKTLATAWNHLKYNGKLVPFLKTLGFPAAIVDADPMVAIVKDKVEKEFDLFGDGFKALARFEYRSEAGQKLKQLVGSMVQTNQEVIDALAKFPTIKKFFDDFHSTKFSTAYSVGKNPMYGEWVKTEGDPTKTTMNDLFDAIREHTSKMNGCWNVNYGGVAINNGSGDPSSWVPGCLVDNMTCNNSAVSTYSCFPPHLRKCGKSGASKCYRCSGTGCDCLTATKFSKSCYVGKTEIPPTSAVTRCKATFWLGAQDFMGVSFKDAVEAISGGAVVDPQDEPEDDTPVVEEEEDAPGFFATTWYIWVIGFTLILMMLLKN